MNELTPRELMAVAQRHSRNPEVAGLLVGIREQQSLAAQGFMFLEAILPVAKKGISLQEDDYSPTFGGDMDIVKAAARVSASQATLSVLLMTLTSTLQRLEPSAFQ